MAFTPCNKLIEYAPLTNDKLKLKSPAMTDLWRPLWELHRPPKTGDSNQRLDWLSLYFLPQPDNSKRYMLHLTLSRLILHELYIIMKIKEVRTNTGLLCDWLCIVICPPAEFYINLTFWHPKSLRVRIFRTFLIYLYVAISF